MAEKLGYRRRKQFYPLDKVLPSYEESERGNNHNNFFFRMRYDVTFKIGDYVGPLNYKFTGDDDLWVVLDGKKIVIDLGGIHSAKQQETLICGIILVKQI